MTDVAVLVFVQARMSSRRFPGKVLAPFRGRPVIDLVVEQVAKALPRDRIIVATSTEPSDDPLAAHLRAREVSVFRGSLEDVFGRFQGCLTEHPCTWFFRVCADSPLLNPQLFVRLLEHRSADVDLVTNVFPRSFPKGQSLELVNAQTFRALDSKSLSLEQREHITKVFYDDPSRFHIANVAADGLDLSRTSVTLDTLDDFLALESDLGPDLD